MNLPYESEANTHVSRIVQQLSTFKVDVEVSLDKFAVG